jgi:hypothetical protein
MQNPKQGGPFLVAGNDRFQWRHFLSTLLAALTGSTPQTRSLVVSLNQDGEGYAMPCKFGSPETSGRKATSTFHESKRSSNRN